MCAPYGERARLRLIFTAKQKARTHTGVILYEEQKRDD